MSRLNRDAPRGSGIPSTSRAPLLENGSRQVNNGPEISAAINSNTLFSHLTYGEKLGMIGTFLEQPTHDHQESLSVYIVSEDTNTTKIRDHLKLTFKFTVACYTPSIGPTFNSSWFKQLGNGLAIVPSSALLLALSQSLIVLSDMTCLFIDDAHSIALEDFSSSLAMIVLEYYGLLVYSKRPRIIGFTPYPLHLEDNFGHAALRMEELLDAQIFGDLGTRRIALKREVDRLAVSVLDYPKLNLLEDSPSPEGEYRLAMEATLKEIGYCCYPLLEHLNIDSLAESMTTRGLVFGIPPLAHLSRASPKLRKLLQFLQAASQVRDYRCIIIANNPFTVLALGWILSTLQKPGIRSAVYTEQFEVVETLEQFIAGSINTLICTDVILNTIDGGICTHVLWFDPYSSLIAFAHSRLLTRHTEASLVLMAECDNRQDYHAARDILHLEPLVSNWVFNMDLDGGPVPPPSLTWCPRFSGNPIILSPLRPRSQENPYILDPTTGSRIYIKDATEVLYRYLAHQSANDKALVPVRIFAYSRTTTEGVLWRCTVELSTCVPPLKLTGASCSSKAAARGSASFKACLTLFELRLLPSFVFPLRPMHTLAHGVFQHVNAGGTFTSSHPIASPIFWHNCILAAPSRIFHPLVVNFTTQTGPKAYRSMIILTRLPLTSLETFSIFSSQNESTVSLRPCAPLILSTERVELVFRYTMHLWRIVANKPFECPSGELAYFVCPVIANDQFRNSTLDYTTPIDPFIAWTEVDSLVSWRVRPLNCASTDDIVSDLSENVIQDRSNEFTRRFEGGQLRQDLSPLSQIMKEQETGPSISLLDYYTTHRHAFEGIKNLQQPIIEAQFLPGLVNRLDPKEPTAVIQKNFLVPEMCYLSSIPATTFHTALIIPSIIWHIENVLVAKELNLTLFNGQIRDDLLMHALCSEAARRTFNYERLEFLGDTFIKYAASAYLYGTEPEDASRTLHTRRQKMVNNRVLCTGAQTLGLPPSIQSEPFRPRYWRIPNTAIVTREHIQDPARSGSEYTEHMKTSPLTRRVAPKTVADVVEAIIGAALLSGGERLAFSAAKVLGFSVPKTCDWLDVISHAPSKVVRVQELHDKEILKGVMKIIDITLEDPELLLQALHHPSLSTPSESYERLEFLGDSVLDMLVIQSFFADEEKWTPHSMTLIKSSMVSNRALAIICVESGLHRLLLHDTPHLTQNIKLFVQELEACKREAQNDSQRLRYWSGLQAPKALGDVVESLLGAVYVSSGFRLSRVKTVYDRLLKPFYDRYIDKQAMVSHPMSRLMKKLENAGCNALSVSKIPVPSKTGKGNATKCEVKMHNRLIADAVADRPKLAITLATEEAILRLDNQFDSIMKGCICKSAGRGKKRKRVSAEGEIEDNELESSEALLGDDAEHPIDVDMFDF